MSGRVELLAVRGVSGVLRLLPERMVAPLGAALGSAAYLVDRRHREIALDNLAAALPERTAAERRAIVRGAFRHFGRLLFELLKFGTLPVDRIMARVEFEGEDNARAAYAQGRGVLFVTGHFGFWELNAIVHAVQLGPIGLLARTLDHAGLNALLESIRQRTGNFVIYRQGTIRRVMRALQQGQGVAVLIDQHILERDAVVVDFFGRPAATTGMVAALALRTGAPVVPVFSRPVGHGRYRMIYEHPVEPPPADAPDALREFTQCMTRVLEDHVRRDPELWLWMHRRWREDLTSVMKNVERRT